MKNTRNGSFYVACDASNKGNLKLYPVAIQYFDLESGIISAILDFYEDSDETSETNAYKLMLGKQLRTVQAIAHLITGRISRHL
jgi:hypothetical protein